MPTILITGASTGIGRACVHEFQQKGWNVAATMRSPEREQELQKLERVRLLALDVTDRASIERAVADTLTAFGQIDVVLNNAGYGLSGPFEAQTPEQIKRQFDTNVFGLMDVCRAVLPHFRQRKSGVLINVSSVGGRLGIPLYSTYHGTKWAVDGFSESLWYELRQLGISVKIIEPGAIKTDFADRSAVVADYSAMPDYKAWADKVLNNMKGRVNAGTAPEKVAEAIYGAATDGTGRLRYIVGPDAQSALFIRRFIPQSWFSKQIKQMFGA